MSDEYTVAGNFQRTDDPRAEAEYEYRMGRVQEREDELDCVRCEGGGNYSEMAPCTTFGPGCGCEERVLVDPCPDCGGSGIASPRKDAG